MNIDTKKLRELAETATPGPWQWYGNTKQYEVYLATTHSGRRFVMDFVRWGMGGAQPRFQVTIDGEATGGGVMRSLVDLAGGDARAKEKALGLPVLGPLFEVDYRRQFVGIGHPDAAWIAAADPQTVLALLDEVDRLRGLVDAIDRTLRVSAAEYVPAIQDVFCAIDAAGLRAGQP